MALRLISALALLCLSAQTAHAQSILGEDANFGLSGGVSTLGLTLEPSLRINDNWGVRMPLGGGSISLEDRSNGQEYSGDMDMGGIGILGDYYPFRSSGFRISAGAFYTDYSADLTSNDVTISGFPTSVDVTAKIRQRKDLMPAIAVGYDGPIGRSAMLSFTVGGMFGDGFDVSASENSGFVPQELIDAEVADIRDDLKDYDVIPYIQLTVGFKF